MSNVEEAKSRFDSMTNEDLDGEGQARIGRGMPLKDLMALTRNKVEAVSLMNATNFKIRLRRLPQPLDIPAASEDDTSERKLEPIRKKPPLKKPPVEIETEKPSPPPTPDKIFSDEAVAQMYAVAQLYCDVALDLQAYSYHAAMLNDSFKEAAIEMNNLENRLSKGQLLWRIPNFRESWARAKLTPESVVMYSPAFHTHPNGYQMSLTLCPYGDGNARGQSVSLFFCLEKNAHDALLPWPFKQRVEFTLLDQSEEEKKKHVLTAFEPKPTGDNMQFLQRPTLVRNPSLGMRRFVTHKNLWSGRYVVDDTVFIRVTVDLKGIPIH